MSLVRLVKDLGLKISHNLILDKHISKKLSLCYSLFISLRRNHPSSLPFSTKCCLYKSYISLSLVYASEVWFPSNSDLRKLELLQKWCRNWICFGTDYKDRLLKCNLLPMCFLQFRDLVMLILMLFGFYDMPLDEHFYLEYKSRLLRVFTRVPFHQYYVFNIRHINYSAKKWRY